jgi:alkanesulfonate monooxygenase SsuD/methylene tetrahydromethanopterin reductase-like flavin-dependent oxidoreductase (luciferase family)
MWTPAGFERRERNVAVDFGLILQPGWLPIDPPDMLTYNRRAIALLSPEFTTLWTEDHFQKGARPALEAWTVLAFMAAEQPRFKLGNLVLGQSYRNPALVAKMSATLQYLSGGRLILGLGAGWQEDEYRAYGYAFPSGGTRVAELAEAIEVIRALWTQSPATWHGQHYHVEAAYCEPRPDPAPPIVIGGSGDKLLRVVARLADGWNTGLPLEKFHQRHAVLRQHCADMGRDPAAIAVSLYAHAWFTDDATAFAARAADFRASEVLLLGPTPADALAMLRPYLAAGATHVTVKPHSLATIERFAAEVAPALAQG